MRYRYTMRLYQWLIGQRFRLRPLEVNLVWQLNRMQKRHRPKWVAEHARRQAERRARAQ